MNAPPMMLIVLVELEKREAQRLRQNEQQYRDAEQR
jgi:hypothetical protein